jgi:hypothetical protein
MRMTQLGLFIVLYPAVRLLGLSLTLARMLRSGIRSGVWQWRNPTASNPFVSQIEVVLQQSAPAALCVPCLATKLAVPEKELRGAARLLTPHPDIRVHFGACHVCQRWERVIRMIAPSA